MDQIRAVEWCNRIDSSGELSEMWAREEAEVQAKDATEARNAREPEADPRRDTKYESVAYWVEHTAEQQVSGRLAQRALNESKIRHLREISHRLRGERKEKPPPQEFCERLMGKDQRESQDLQNKDSVEEMKGTGEDDSRSEQLYATSIDDVRNAAQGSPAPSSFQRSGSHMEEFAAASPESRSPAARAITSISSSSKDTNLQDPSEHSRQHRFRIGTATIKIRLVPFTSVPRLANDETDQCLDDAYKSSNGNASDLYDASHQRNGNDGSLRESAAWPAADAPSNPNTNALQEATGSGTTKQSSSSQQSHSDQAGWVTRATGNDNGNDNGDGDGSGRGSGESVISRDQKDITAKPRFACPYQAYERARQCFKPTSRNQTGGCKGIKRLRQHLKRSHMLSSRCQRCWRMFDKQVHRAVHIAEQSCGKRDRPATEVLMTEEQERRIRCLGTAATEEKTWWELFQILIPGMTRHRIDSLKWDYSPYYMMPTGVPSTCNTALPPQPPLPETGIFVPAVNATGNASIDPSAGFETIMDIPMDIPMGIATPSLLPVSEFISVPVFGFQPLPDSEVDSFHSSGSTSVPQQPLCQPSFVASSGTEIPSTRNTTLWSSAHESGVIAATGVSRTESTSQWHLRNICTRLQGRCSLLLAENTELRVGVSKMLDALEKLLIEESGNITPSLETKLGELSESLSSIYTQPRWDLGLSISDSGSLNV